MSCQTGIWKPASLEVALTIRTTFARTSQARRYEDQIGGDGLLRYKYRGTDPNHSDNRSCVRRWWPVCRSRTSSALKPGIYVPQYPVWVVGEDAPNHEFAVTLDQGQWAVDIDMLPTLNREYVALLTRSRLHQPAFRTMVLRAYEERCALCHLRHPELVDDWLIRWHHPGCRLIGFCHAHASAAGTGQPESRQPDPKALRRGHSWTRHRRTRRP